MCAYAWEINIEKHYTGPKTSFTARLLLQIQTHCERILNLLTAVPMKMETIKEILRGEKIVNTFLIMLGNPDVFLGYEDTVDIAADFEAEPVDLKNYRSKLNNFTCSFDWALKSSIDLKGGDHFCQSIFGK